MVAPQYSSMSRAELLFYALLYFLLGYPATVRAQPPSWRSSEDEGRTDASSFESAGSTININPEGEIGVENVAEQSPAEWRRKLGKRRSYDDVNSPLLESVQGGGATADKLKTKKPRYHVAGRLLPYEEEDGEAPTVTLAGETESACAVQIRERDVHIPDRARATPLPRPIASATTEGVSKKLNLFRLGDNSPP